MTADERRLIFVETAGSIAWFAMDACWMFGSRRGAALLAVPTVGLALLVFRFTARSWPNWLVTGSMAAWACMNVLWMGADTSMIGWGLVGGKVFFAAGALMLVAAVLVSRWRGEAVSALVSKFRRLRLRREATPVRPSLL